MTWPAGALLVDGLGALGWRALWLGKEAAAPPMASLVEAVGARRLVEGRLGSGFGFGPRVEVTAPSAERALLSAMARTQSRAAAEPSVGTRHALAIAHLLVGEHEPAVEILESLVAEGTATAAILSDLSVAYLSGARDRPHYHARAIETADHSLELSPSYEPAHFNLAVAAQALGLKHTASEAFRRAGKASDRDWAAEASRLGEILEAEPTVRATRGYQDLDIVLADPSGTDEDWLESVRRLAAELATMTGDVELRTLGEPSPHSLPEWRRILRQYGTAKRDYSGTAWDEARRGFRGFLDSAPAGLSLRPWAEAYDAILESRIGGKSRAVSRLNALLGLRIPHGLRGRCHWTLGLVAMETGDYGLALRHYEAAQQSFAWSRETDYEVAISGQISNVLDRLGRYQLAWGSMVRLLRAGVSDESRRVATLGRTANMARDQKLFRAAGRLAKEALRAAEASGTAELAAVHVSLARIAASRGRPGEALLELSRAKVAHARVSDPGFLGRIETEIALLETELQSLGVLDLGVVTEPPRRLVESGEMSRLFPLTVARGLGLERQGKREGAIAAFREAVSQIEKTTTPERARVSVARPVIATPFERLIASSFEEGDHWEALALVERLNGLRRLGRRPLLDGKRLKTAVASWADATPVVVLFPLSDRLLVWEVARGAVRGVEIGVEKSVLETWAEEVLRSVERGHPLAEHHIGRTLLDFLRTEGSEGGEVTTIQVFPHGALTRLPYNALLLGQGASPANPPAVEVLSSLLPAAAPAFSPRRGIHVFSPGRLNGKAFLPGATAESRQVAALYKEASVLIDRDATPEAFDRALPVARVIHFAGHASQNEAHPEMSSLWMADPVQGTAIPVTLADLRQRGLEGLPLLYLSACSAGLTSEETGFTASSLGDLFLDAGVGSVVASVTEIDDAASSAVAVRFHSTYASGKSPALALRGALVEVDPAIRLKAAAYQVYTRKTAAVSPSTR